MSPASRSRHPLQYAILEDLRIAPTGRRYRDMKPPDIANDAYNYHLQYLVRQGLVTKTSDHYELSATGKKYLVDLNPIDQTGESHRFKLASLCLLIQGSGDQATLLYQRRTRQPFAGNWGIIGGGIKRGELAIDTAHRRLNEEAGLTATFQLLGLMRKRHFDSNRHVYSDILYHLCASQEYTGELIERNHYGEQSWLPLAAAVAIEADQVGGSPQLAAILRQLATKTLADIPLFYLEETYHLDIY